MFFANGDCFITYENHHYQFHQLKEVLIEKFNQIQTNYVHNFYVSDHSLTFKYSPIQVMEEHNTIEPYHIVLDEVVRIVNELEVK